MKIKNSRLKRAMAKKNHNVASASASASTMTIGSFTQPTRPPPPPCYKCQRNEIVIGETKKLLDEANDKLLEEKVEKEELKRKLQDLKELVLDLTGKQNQKQNKKSELQIMKSNFQIFGPPAPTAPMNDFSSPAATLDLNEMSSIKIEPLDLMDDDEDHHNEPRLDDLICDERKGDFDVDESHKEGNGVKEAEKHEKIGVENYIRGTSKKGSSPSNPVEPPNPVRSITSRKPKRTSYFIGLN